MNQLTQVGAAALSYDAKGNLTFDPVTGRGYGYSSDNLLQHAIGIGYGPLNELVYSSTQGLAYDGLDLMGEYDHIAGLVLARYVHGSGLDEPLVWYEGSGTSNRKFLSSDERGSIVAVTDGSGALLGINRYDEFGKPQSTNIGRFQYTGQKWIPELGLYHYKARFYAPHLRFLQPDPIGYAGGTNLYAYVLNDPVNFTDSLGLLPPPVKGPCGVTAGTCSDSIDAGSILITGERQPEGCSGSPMCTSYDSLGDINYITDNLFPRSWTSARDLFHSASSTEPHQRTISFTNKSWLHIYLRHIAFWFGDKTRFLDDYSNVISISRMIGSNC